MKDQILSLPKQIKEGLKNAQNIKVEGDFNQIIVAGMGGSAWPAEILSTWLKLPIPMQVYRNYNLPCKKSKTLLICVSYSGNTEETLSAYKTGIENNFTTIAVSSNGKLKKLAQKNKNLFIEIPSNFAPRMATGYIFTAVYSILKNSGIIKNQDKAILKAVKNIKPKEKQKSGKNLAETIKGKIPIIYTSEKLKSLGYIWKIKFNENSKIPAFNNHFPELNHNELEGNSHEKENDIHKDPVFYSIILKNENDHPKIKKAMDITNQILNQTGTPSEIIKIKGNNLLEKIFNSILLADWTSYYLAQIYNIDPLKTPAIKKFKQEMK